jgi:hypothetical protein
VGKGKVREGWMENPPRIYLEIKLVFSMREEAVSFQNGKACGAHVRGTAGKKCVSKSGRLWPHVF